MPSSTLSDLVSSDSFSRNRAVLYRELYHHLTTPGRGSSRPAPASAIDLPRPLARSLVHFYSLLKIGTIAASDDTLADQISLAVAGWFASLWEDLQASAPMETLLATRPGADEPSPDRLAEHLDIAIRLWPEKRPSWETLRRRYHLAGSDLHRRALCGQYKTIRRTAVHHQRDLRRERALRLVASPLADHLNEIVPCLQRDQEKVRSLFGTWGQWDILDAHREPINWDRLMHCRKILETAPGLHHLARLIVRGVEADEVREEVIERTVPITIPIELENGFGDVTGIARQTHIVGALPQELSLLAFPETEDLFTGKLAAGTIIGLHHDRRRKSIHQTRKTVTERVRRNRRQGPVYLCVDTSGSMRGTPESVARGMILGTVRESILSRRPATVLVFTNRLEVLETGVEKGPDSAVTGAAMVGTSPPVVPEPLIQRLVTLLDSSLTDGADITPAMEHALTSLEQADDGTAADVVIVSDVRFPRIPPRHLNRLYNLQATDTARFHCLTVHEEPIQDPLNIFDYRWFFNVEPSANFNVHQETGPIGLDLQAFRQF